MDRREWIRERERLEARIDTLEGQLHAFLASDAIVHGGAVTDYGEAPRLQTDARAALTKMRMIAARRKVALRAARKRAQEAERAAMEVEAIVLGVRARLDADPQEDTLDAVQWIGGDLAAERAAHEQTRARLAEAEERIYATDPADLAGVAAREAQAPAQTLSVIACGAAPDDYDATAMSEDGRCPHCGAEGRLVRGYGLGAGGCGAYSMCEACGRFCDSRQDDDSEEAQAPEAEPSREEPEAIAAFRAWCALNEDTRTDAINDGWMSATVHEEEAAQALEAAPEVLRLYDEAIDQRDASRANRREEVASLGIALNEARARIGDLEARIAGRDAFLARLAHGGHIVSTAAMSETAIAIARASDRLRVSDDGLGYVYVPGPHEGAILACGARVGDDATTATPEPTEEPEAPSVDPGEGWRLLGPDEVVCVGDEWWNGGASEWRTVSVAPLGTRAGDGFGPIRRRIAEADTERRVPGCQCQIEAGDSPCRIHGEDEPDPVHAPTGDLPPVAPEAAEEAELVRIVERVAAGVYRRAESRHLYPNTKREYVVLWKDDCDLADYLEADKAIGSFCAERGDIVAVGTRRGKAEVGDRRVWPRVEDAAPEAQAETMRPWRGEPEVVEDEKGRWFIRK